MIDRKTQNRDAGIELLEYRDKRLKLCSAIFYIFALVCILFIGIFMMYHETNAIMFTIVCIGCILMTGIIELNRSQLDTLIYLKRHLEKEHGKEKQKTQE